MKLFLLISCVLLYTLSNAQNRNLSISEIPALPMTYDGVPPGQQAPLLINTGQKLHSQQVFERTTDSCGIDTLEYLTNKNTVLEWYYLADTTFNNGGGVHDYYSSYAQYYDCPQEISIHGISFYAYVFTAGDSALVDVNLYSAASDSFPDQLISSTSVWIYDNYNGSNINVMKQRVEFDSVITMDQAYLVSVSTQTKKELLVMSNSFNNMDGNGEELSFTYYSNPDYPAYIGWYDQYYFAANWDFDWILEPIVSYQADIDMIVSADSLCEPDLLCVQLSADTIFWNRMYNSDLPGNPASLISFGDGNSSSNMSDCNVYAVSGTYTIAGSIEINTWKIATCQSIENKTIVYNSRPTADFAYTDNFGGMITFDNNSTESDSILWDLGNGLSTTDTNFVYTYDPSDTTYLITLVAFNACGTDTMQVSISPTPLSDNVNSEYVKVNVYPNPANETLFIQTNTTYAVWSLYSTEGQLIHKGELSGSSGTISLNQLDNGIYILMIDEAGKHFQKKILVRR